MKRAGTICLGLAAGLALTASVRADSPAPDASGDNPYAPVVVRNVFGLNPPTPPGPTVPVDPPPKIIANGIMSIFGRLQALYKVTETVPGQSPKEKSYILTVGQREDDIEVVKIDDKANIVTFNNHGTVQDIPLTNGAAAPGAPLPAAAGGISVPMNRFGNPNLRGRGPVPPIAPAAAPVANNGPAILGAGPAFMGSGQPAQAAMTPDDLQALIAAKHAAAQAAGSAIAPLFPPTKYDNEANGGGGNPDISGPGGMPAAP
jgi:hypothetical protein